ncbi:hypothetical protein [Glycomyces sp. YM15]|uniref:hypothetical protein n=1 Tax=Glycomyces sp. YM15 TaxID=2800446 RepID=UPI0019636D18|nr:hypothetical protein [Glycomyces sp. YM15]
MYSPWEICVDALAPVNVDELFRAAAAAVNAPEPLDIGEETGRMTARLELPAGAVTLALEHRGGEPMSDGKGKYRIDDGEMEPFGPFWARVALLPTYVSEGHLSARFVVDVTGWLDDHGIGWAWRSLSDPRRETRTSLEALQYLAD